MTQYRKNQAIAAGDPGHWKTDKSGGARYIGCGQRGGTRSHAEVDDRDLVDAIKELVTSRAMLAEAYALPARTAQRREALAVAVGKVALAGRILDDLVIRRSGVTEPAYNGDEP